MKDIYMKILIIIVGLLIFGATKYILKLRDDNIIEEQVENMIKDQTGLDIDLTPQTPE